MKTETRKLYSRVLQIFLPNIIKIERHSVLMDGNVLVYWPQEVFYSTLSGYTPTSTQHLQLHLLI